MEDLTEVQRQVYDFVQGKLAAGETDRRRRRAPRNYCICIIRGSEVRRLHSDADCAGAEALSQAHRASGRL